MNKNIEDLQRFSNKLRFIIEELAEDYLPDDTPNGTERLINKAFCYINGICRLSEVVEGYVPKEEACQCGELKEILKLIPKNISLGEFLELYDLIANHFQKKPKRYTMKNINVLDYMDSLEKEDKDLDLFVKMYEALSSFLTDFDFLKDSMGLTQKDAADKTGAAQSAISRIASMKTNPSYKQLQKMAEAVGGELLITPMKDMTVQVPYDLQNTVRDLAKGENKTTNEYLDEVIRKTLLKEIENK